ncbi:MAG TPA: alpha/beta hydrolase [Mycobacterium sp.]
MRDKFAEIDGDRCLAVMLTGDYDYLTTPDDSARTAAQINNAEFIEMRGIGHFPMSENHDLFRTFLLQALEVIEKKSHATT